MAWVNYTNRNICILLFSAFYMSSMIDLSLIGEYGLLGAFIAGMLFLYKIRNNDLQHITEHLEELQENTKKVLEELVRIRILLESERNKKG